MLLLGTSVCVMLGCFYVLLKPATRPVDWRPFLNRDYAHRGLHDNSQDAPENSMRAFEKAIAAGYGIECDVQLTKDHEVVVFHDEDLVRLCDESKRVSDVTVSQLRTFTLLHTSERVPLCQDVLDLVNGQVPIIVEIKSESTDVSLLCEKVIALLDRYPGQFMVESFNPLVVGYFRKHRPQFIRGQLSGGLGDKKGWLYFAIRHLLTNVIARPDFIAYEQEYQHRWVLKVIRYVWRTPLIVYTVKTRQAYDGNKKRFMLQIFEGFRP